MIRRLIEWGRRHWKEVTVAGAVVASSTVVMAAGAPSASAGTCYYNTSATGQTFLSSASSLITHQARTIAAWQTTGAIDGCKGSTVRVNSSSIWCMWNTKEFGYKGTCSGWMSVAGHSEVNSNNSRNWAPYHTWKMRVEQNMTSGGNRTIRCTITAGNAPSFVLCRSV